MSLTNCVNCGAPIEVGQNKCPYCGTLYISMGHVDLNNLDEKVLIQMPYEPNLQLGEHLCYIGSVRIDTTNISSPKVDEHGQLLVDEVMKHKFTITLVEY